MDTESEIKDHKTPFLIKCRKCRCTLINSHEQHVLDSHGKTLDILKIPSEPETCPNCSVFYILDDEAPGWVGKSLHVGGWLKGKLKCPDCSSRIGSFNYIDGIKCNCQRHLVPPLHITKCKVDVYSNHIRK